jgi:hypothetical protein
MLNNLNLPNLQQQHHVAPPTIDYQIQNQKNSIYPMMPFENPVANSVSEISLPMFISNGLTTTTTTTTANTNHTPKKPKQEKSVSILLIFLNLCKIWTTKCKRNKKDLVKKFRPCRFTIIVYEIQVIWPSIC